MKKTNKGRKVALVAGLALVVLSVGVVWTYRKEIQSWFAFRRDFESLGTSFGGKHGFKGVLDELRIYDRGLSGEEIRLLSKTP